MLRYPITHIFPGPYFSTTISGPHVQVTDNSTGIMKHTTTDKAGPIRCAAIDPEGRYLATAGDDKMLKIWELVGLRLVNERELPKRPTAIHFTADAQTVLVSDKFGDVFSYTFQFTPLTEKQKKDALSSHENPSGGQLILGHASLLNTFLLSSDEKYIITADRDEHIRVSWYPQGYNIEMYCLGHTKYVSAIHIPAFAPSELVSGGGDPELKIWDWVAGTVKHEINVWDIIEPYIHIRSQKRKRGDDGEGGPGAKRKGKGKKAKGKGKAKAESSTTEPRAAPEEEDSTLIGSIPLSEPHIIKEENTAKVLVIHKIESLPSRYLVFSAVGASALFIATYPSDGSVSSVRAFDLGLPVLDFAIAQDELVWVSLDGNWAEPSDTTEQAFVRVFDVSSGELVKVTDLSAILATLNSGSLHPASEDDTKTLGLYADLVDMPKLNEPEHDQETEAPPTEVEKPTNKKTLGRLKNKQKVLEKMQAMATDTTEDGPKEPDAKKSKSEHGDDSPHDVAMKES